MKARLIKKTELVQSVWSFEFETIETEFEFRAGQFFKLSIINPPEMDNRGNGRYFGFVNSPTQKNKVEVVFYEGVSTYKKYIQAAPLGIEMEISNIQGEMCLPDDHSLPIVFLTCGVGIAPIMSMLRLVREQSLPYQILVIYGKSDEEQRTFEDELKQMQNIKLLTPDEIDEQFLKENITGKRKVVMVPGAVNFVMRMAKLLRNVGVPQDQMKLEIFTGY